MMESYDYKAKDLNQNKKPKLKCYNVLLLGESSVGKTSLISLYNGKDFNSVQRYPTIGLDYITITHEDLGFKIKLLDTAGQERFRNIANSYYRNSDVIVFVYSVDNYESFKTIVEWDKRVKELLKDDSIVKVLIGNKIDNMYNKDKKEFFSEEAKAFAVDNNMGFFELSCKTGYNLNKSYKYILDAIISKHDKSEVRTKSDSILLCSKDNAGKKDVKNSECCK